MKEVLLLCFLLLGLFWEAPGLRLQGLGRRCPWCGPRRELPSIFPAASNSPSRMPTFCEEEGSPGSINQTGGQPAQVPALARQGLASPRRLAHGRYTVLSVAPGGLRSGRQPLHPRVQLEERGLQRGDFSLWLRPAQRADEGEYHAFVRLPDRALSCSLRLRVGQASMTASPPGTLKPSDWVILNCSFSRPDRPVSVRWFQGQSRVPVHSSPRHYLAESFLLLPQVSPLDSGTWGCVLTYRDGFNVSITHNLKVLGLEPAGPLTVYAAEGSKAELPCRLSPGVGTPSLLIAKWTPPGGGPEREVAGKSGSFTLPLEAVGLAQAGTYTCSIHLQGQQLSVTVTLAVITGQPQNVEEGVGLLDLELQTRLSYRVVTLKSVGLPDSPGKLLCEVAPASGAERFVWRPLNNLSRSSPGPELELQEARLLAEQWQCQLYEGQKLLGATVYTAESSSGARSARRISGDLRGGHLFLVLILGALSLSLLVTGAFGFHLWRRQLLRRRFSALEHGIHPPPAQSKIELERELELDVEQETEPEQEPEPEPEPEPRQL
ncbi:Lymphocyte activation gene 3 protein [Apodemus speciosus]|uniref:Lymphocyte activation gene 3 protein n=1 Tax=Apodemus speciosus TaxID=105296 RepID=A0ABQ0EW64_APOSI